MDFGKSPPVNILVEIAVQLIPSVDVTKFTSSIPLPHAIHRVPSYAMPYPPEILKKLLLSTGTQVIPSPEYIIDNVFVELNPTTIQ